MQVLYKIKTVLAIVFYLLTATNIFGQGKEDYYKQAVENARAGKYHLAIEQLGNVIKNDPDNYEAYYNKGFCEAQLHDYETAIKDLNASLYLSPDFGNALYYRGFCFNKLGKYQLAIADFTHGLQIQSNSDLYAGLAYAYLQTKEYEKALKNYDLAITLNKDTVEKYYFDKATCELFLNRLSPASLDIDHYLEQKPKSAEGNELAFQIYYQKQDLDKARAAALRLQKIKGKVALGHYYEGMVAFAKKQFDKAILDFGAAIKANDKYAEAYFSRGMCYRYLKDKEKACADMNKALSLGFTQQQEAVNSYCR